MTYKIPPLNALRAFEAAARHLSFKSAAAELCVTPGAVSQQVKSLEEVLGVALFERIHNGLILTEEGQRYLAPVRSAFTGISAATQMISPRTAGADLTVAVEPEFGVKWLVPKIPAFQAAHPDARIRIANGVSAEDLVTGRADIAILPGVSSFQGVQATRLIGETLTPACAPHLTDRWAGDIGAAKILTCGDEAEWALWLNRRGEKPLAHLDEVRFEDRDLALYAAISGKGLALASSIRDAEALGAGRLVPPFAERLETGLDYFLLVPAGRVDCPGERAFADWLTAEAGPDRPEDPAQVPAGT